MSRMINFSVVYVEDNPDHKKVTGRKLFVVGGKKYSKWVFMKCPCGCGEVLTLSLMKNHTPSWTLKVDKFSRATLSPSIWKQDGCKSHFWIRKGKLEWAYDE